MAAQARHDCLGDILDGRCRVAMSLPAQSAGVRIGASVDGEFHVSEPGDAELVLLVDDAHASLLEKQALEPVETLRCIDPTLQLSVYRATDCHARCDVHSSVEDIFTRGALLTSALLLGNAEATLQRSVDYAVEREQYGRPIGGFQAIKHYCSDMALRCESVRASLYHASVSVRDGSPSAAFDTCTVKALANEAAQKNANTAVQIHGGMGFTQEMDIHLFVKRAQVLSSLFGSERYHLRRLLAQGRPD